MGGTVLYNTSYMQKPIHNPSLPGELSSFNDAVKNYLKTIAVEKDGLICIQKQDHAASETKPAGKV